MTIQGILKEKKEVQNGTSKAGKDWVKQDFIIYTGDQYNPIACFGLFGQEKIDRLNAVEVGDSIDIEFNLQCREHNGKYYTNLDAWKVEKAGTPPPPTTPKVDEESDDLPF